MKPVPQIMLSEGIYKQQPVVCIDFEFRWDIVERMKKISGATYISLKKCGYINESEFDLTQFKTTITDDFVLNSDNCEASNKLQNVIGPIDSLLKKQVNSH